MSSTRWYKPAALIPALVAALLCGAATIPSGGKGGGEPYALARLSVVSMRAEPRHSAEQISQALMGTPMEVIGRDGQWARVKGPDGYEGWIIDHSLVFHTPGRHARWRQAPKVRVAAPYELHDADAVTDLVNGDILEAEGDSLRLPDGRMISARGIAVVPADSVGPLRPELLPQFARRYLGVPYLWGGLSSKGMDCSGLVRMAYMAQGRLLPRDAWQQALTGREVPPDSLRAGDLIFFGSRKSGRITHVGIYDRDSLYVHSSQMVRVNSLDPRSPLYLPLHVIARRRTSGTPAKY